MNTASEEVRNNRLESAAEEAPLGTAANASDVIWNVPNVLSLTRLFMAIVVFALLPWQLYVSAFVLFVIAAGTDWMDGWYARRFNQITKFGRILDPFCDKIIICGTSILVAVEMAQFPWPIRFAGWMVVIIVGREMLVTAMRGFIEQQGGDFSAKMSGKLKMLFQCIAVGASLIALRLAQNAEHPNGADTPLWLAIILGVSLWAAVVTTLYSGTAYVIAAVKLIREMSTSAAA